MRGKEFIVANEATLKSRLKSRLRSIFSQDCDGERYRYLLKLQLERLGHGKNAWAFPHREIKRNR